MSQIEIDRQLKLAWKDYSKIVRMEEASINGVCECVTCGNKHAWDGHEGIMQAGHFYPARFLRSTTKFLRVNIHPQCRRCNTMPRVVATKPYAANAVIDVANNYRHWMLTHYGLDVIEDIRSAEKGSLKWTVELATEWRADCMTAMKKLKAARAEAIQWDPWEMIGKYTPELPAEVMYEA